MQDVFATYWREHAADETPEKLALYREGVRKVLQQPTDEAALEWLDGFDSILDAGCGAGWFPHLYRANAEQRWTCVEFSDAAEVARRWLADQPNTEVVQADLLDYRGGPYDLIVAQGVLHHLADPRAGFDALVEQLAPGGWLCLSMIRRQAPERDLLDRHVRETVTKMAPAEAEAAALAIGRLGQALQGIGTVDVPAGLEDLLGIPAGPVDVQRFVHSYFLKCFWNPGFTERENAMWNYDWYAPAYAWPHSEGELWAWFGDAGLVDVAFWQPGAAERHEMIRVKGRRH